MRPQSADTAPVVTASVDAAPVMRADRTDARSPFGLDWHATLHPFDAVRCG
jgi:hypothetical protein